MSSASTPEHNGSWTARHGKPFLRARQLHRWDVTPAEARAIQLDLRERLDLADRPGKIRFVAGADVAFRLPERRSWERGTGRAIAGVVVFTFPELEEVERVSAERVLTFPYVPGLLSFRELPALLDAFAMLQQPPDLIFCDGQGYAHPRRMGLATHLGILLDTPAIGCAKSRLTGEHKEPGAKTGAWAPLLAPFENERAGKMPLETIGAVLRTRAGAQPIYVSCGYAISLPRAVEFTLAVCDGYRIPRPTRLADRLVAEVKKGPMKGVRHKKRGKSH